MRQGDPSTTAAYDDDPVERAMDFVGDGAQRLHVIDLDGAFGSGENLAAVQAICAAVDVPVQTGGGLRNLKHAETAFAAGVSEIILGTLLVEDERLARHIAGRFPGKVIAGIDARGSQVATHGWQERTPVDRDALVRRVAQWGIGRVIFHRDPARRHGRRLRHRRAQRGRRRGRSGHNRQRRRAQHRRFADTKALGSGATSIRASSAARSTPEPSN